MMLSLAVILAITVVLSVTVGYGLRRLRLRHLRLVAEEKVRGHLKLRRRMETLAGKRTNPDHFETVTKAETMYGWVWISATRRPRQPFERAMGWAPTRRAARRRLAHRARR